MCQVSAPLKTPISSNDQFPIAMSEKPELALGEGDALDGHGGERVHCRSGIEHEEKHCVGKKAK